MENNQGTSALDLARKFENEIKRAVAETFKLSSEKLSFALGAEKAVYLSQKEENTLCSLVVDEEKGGLYLVTGKIGEGGASLTDLKSNVIS